MGKSKAKTEGLTFLYNSMSALNGVGYMDKTSPENYAISYIKYKMWRNKTSEAKYALDNWEETLQFAEHLCKARQGLTPNAKQYAKFQDFCNTVSITELNIPDTLQMF
jgi:hypothetical protein